MLSLVWQEINVFLCDYNTIYWFPLTKINNRWKNRTIAPMVSPTAVWSFCKLRWIWIKSANFYVNGDGKTFWKIHANSLTLFVDFFSFIHFLSIFYPSPPQLDAFQRNIEAIRTRHTTLQLTSSQRHKNLTNGLHFSTKLFETLPTLEDWVEQRETEVWKLPCTACFEPTITRALKLSKDMMREFEAKQPVVDDVGLLCDNIVENIEAGKKNLLIRN